MEVLKQMENKTLGITAVVLSTLILLGTLAVFWSIPEQQQCQTCQEIPECNPVVLIENNTIEKTIEVEIDYKQNVVDAFLAEMQKDKDLRKCSGVKYDEEEISIKKIYDGFTVSENADGDLAVSGVKLKVSYDDGKCYETYTCGLNTEQEIVC